MKEVKLDRVAGPYDQIPFESYMQSPIGLEPKVGSSKTRLIFHLSYNFGKLANENVLNYHTPRSKCKVKYRDLDNVIRACLEAEAEQDFLDDCRESKKPIYLGKLDAQSAFRILPLNKSSWKWLIMLAFHPISGKRCLPFGVSISCALFQRFSNALCYLIHIRTNSPPKRITNYLDNFLFVALAKLLCDGMIHEFLQLCKEISVLIMHEQTEWGGTTVIFLGILLDGEKMILCIPEKKRIKAVKMLQNMCDKCKSTIKDLQVLCGYLNFLNKAIYPGHAFTRRMYAKYAHLVQVGHKDDEGPTSNTIHTNNT